MARPQLINIEAYRFCCSPSCKDQPAAYLFQSCLHPVCNCVRREGNDEAASGAAAWTCPSPDCGLVSRRLLDNVAKLLQPLPVETLCNSELCLVVTGVHGPNDQRFPAIYYCQQCDLRMCRKLSIGHAYKNRGHKVQQLPDPRPSQLVCSRHPSTVTMLCRSCGSALCAECCLSPTACPTCKTKDVVNLIDIAADSLDTLSARAADLSRRAVSLADNRERLAESRRLLASNAKRIEADNRLILKRASEIARRHLTDVAQQIDDLAGQRKTRLCRLLTEWSLEMARFKRLSSLARLVTELQQAEEPSLDVRQRITVGAVLALEKACKSALQQRSVPSAQDCQLGPYLLVRLDFSRSALPKLLSLGGPCLRLVKTGEEEINHLTGEQQR